MNRIALIGYRGSGKSTVGPLLAAKLGWRFVDADTELEARAGRTIAAIFAESGEQTFRDLEAENLARLMQETEIVLATGGGVVMREANREQLKKAFVVWLDTPTEVCWTRIQGDATTIERRPKLTTGGYDEVVRLIEERSPVYRGTANLIIDGSSSPHKVAEQISLANQLNHVH